MYTSPRAQVPDIKSHSKEQKIRTSLSFTALLLLAIFSVRCSPPIQQEPTTEPITSEPKEEPSIQDASTEQTPPDHVGLDEKPDDTVPEKSVAEQTEKEVISPDQVPQAPALQRPFAPVVLIGNQMHRLRGIKPNELVAFRYEAVSAKWTQIPVQVDERREQEYSTIYKTGTVCTQHNFSPSGASFRNLVYADPNTHTGADPDTTLDADDEVVIMVKDVGQKVSSFTAPKGVQANTGVELEIRDPLTPEARGYVYFFQHDGSLQSDAGTSYVQYTFKLASGDYKTTYNHCGNQDVNTPANPEDSEIKTNYYTRHFSYRWYSDGLRILPPLGLDINILEQHKALFAPGVCTRSIVTFSAHEGAFIANINGPIRAIRSYIGANSGPLVQRDHLFYQRREYTNMHLRVHSLGRGLLFFSDYSKDAVGMVYTNNLNPNGVTIDGQQDTVKSGVLEWETLTGKQGNLLHLQYLETDMTLPLTTYYRDEAPTQTTQCSGDSNAYGSSGSWVNGPIDNTDPRRGEAGDKIATFIWRDVYQVEDNSLDNIKAALAFKQFRTNLHFRLQPIDSSGRGTICGDGKCDSPESVHNCAPDCAPPLCGNGTCESHEDRKSCEKDCKPKDCGDKQCGSGETMQNCPEDCKVATNCGDGTCDTFETDQTCPKDCQSGTQCGNGTCEDTESPRTCANDCQITPQTLYACLRSNCTSETTTCQQDNDCKNIYTCFVKCTESRQACLTQCTQSKPQNAADAFKATFTCARTKKCL